MPEMPAPWYTGTYTPAQRAMVAGFILHFRRGFLDASASAGAPAADQIPPWRDETRRYYRDAESVTRFLLYWIGYPVARDQMWEPFNDAYFPGAGPIGGIAP